MYVIVTNEFKRAFDGQWLTTGVTQRIEAARQSEVTNIARAEGKHGVRMIVTRDETVVGKVRLHGKSVSWTPGWEPVSVVDAVDIPELALRNFSRALEKGNRREWDGLDGNTALLRLFGELDVVDSHTVIRPDGNTGSIDTWAYQSSNAGSVLGWGIKNGLVEMVRGRLLEPDIFTLLDRRNQFIEIGPMTNRSSLRVINPTLPQVEVDRLVKKEANRQSVAAKRATARYREMIETRFDRIFQRYPMALLPDQLGHLRVEGLPYLRSYRELIISAAPEQLNAMIYALQWVQQNEASPEVPALLEVGEDDSDAMGSMHF